MIIFDTETTGLIKPIITPIDQQPHIIELAAIKVDDNSLVEVNRLEFMCSVGQPLPDKIVQLTGITDQDLRDKEPFSHHYGNLAEFWIGERIMVAHNLPFDRDLLGFELARIDKLHHFPNCMIHKCTMEIGLSLNTQRKNLTDLYELVTGKLRVGSAHRAMSDVEALVEIVREFRKKQLI